jgi:hypothetical protein
LKEVEMVKLSRLAFVGLVLGIALLLAGASALAAGCKKVSGKVALEAVTGSECPSSVDICATGSFSGGLSGASSFVGTAITATADTPTTGVVLLTGDTTLTTKGGTLLTKDAIVLRTTGAGEFSEVDVIVGGTGEWAGATGTVQASGTFSAATGGNGSYSGEVCFP